MVFGPVIAADGVTADDTLPLNAGLLSLQMSKQANTSFSLSILLLLNAMLHSIMLIAVTADIYIHRATLILFTCTVNEDVSDPFTSAHVNIRNTTE